MRLMSIPCSLAMRRASGEERMRPTACGWGRLMDRRHLRCGSLLDRL